MRTDVDDLTVVSWGGPDLGLLCATKKASTVHYPFCTLDSIPLEPHFRKARQDAAVSAIEWDEGMFYWGLTAGSMRLPFLPSRAGLGSDVFRSDPRLRTVASPYTDEDLVAVPPLRFDVAFVHVNRADAAGNGQILGADPYFDDLFCKCAGAVYMSAEAVVPTAALLDAGPLPTLRINRMAVTGVVEAPGGAGFTECPPTTAATRRRRRSTRPRRATPMRSTPGSRPGSTRTVRGDGATTCRRLRRGARGVLPWRR